MKNTKRHTTPLAATRRSGASANANKYGPTTADTNANVSVAPPPRRVSTSNAATTKPKPPTLATAARSVRTRSASIPPTTTRDQPTPLQKAPTKASRTTTAAAKPRASLVHNAVRRAFHVTTSRDDVTECECLRDELVRVMADHQRQADEIVALRALARSLKEEVESTHEAATIHDHATTLRRHGHTGTASLSSPTNREFFQLDAQVDVLRDENAQLRARIETMEREKRELEDALGREIPRCELLAVQARAELESTTSQLHDEQRENDRLRREVAHYTAQSRSPIRTTAHGVANDKENDGARANSVRAVQERERPAFDESLRESLMSSVASLSMSAASAYSSQLRDDVETLKSELRRLHRSIDASVLNARGGANARHSACQRLPRDPVAREEKAEGD